MKTKSPLTRIRTILSASYLVPALIVSILLASTLITNHRLVARPAASNTPAVQILSPAPDATVNGTIALSANLNGQPQSSYDMFWYVDNGRWNWMDNTTSNAKQAMIDLSGWTWHGANRDYTIMVVGVLHGSGQRSFGNIAIHIGQANTAVPQTITPTSTPTAAPSDILYVNPNTSAAQTAAATNDPTTKRIMTRLAAAPTATWLGNWNTDVKTDVSAVVTAAGSELPVFVAYNIPNRDCGGYSSGGASSPDAYKAWITSVAAGIGSHRAIVVLEPDATAETECLSSAELATRNQLLAFAITTLKNNPGTKVYLDAGNPTWVPADDMAARLQAAGIAGADGFSLNVSNFYPTSDNTAYGTAISQRLNGKHFVIDTSRNGNGSNGAWCNPTGRALGALPTSNTGNPLIDYLLWVKTPGESDGTCNGGPAAGVWWPSYALNLAVNAGW